MFKNAHARAAVFVRGCRLVGCAYELCRPNQSDPCVNTTALEPRHFPVLSGPATPTYLCYLVLLLPLPCAIWSCYTHFPVLSGPATPTYLCYLVLLHPLPCAIWSCYTHFPVLSGPATPTSLCYLVVLHPLPCAIWSCYTHLPVLSGPATPTVPPKVSHVTSSNAEHLHVGHCVTNGGVRVWKGGAHMST
jgi:hypothetical protein